MDEEAVKSIIKGLEELVEMSKRYSGRENLQIHIGGFLDLLVSRLNNDYSFLWICFCKNLWCLSGGGSIFDFLNAFVNEAS